MEGAAVHLLPSFIFIAAQKLALTVIFSSRCTPLSIFHHTPSVSSSQEIRGKMEWKEKRISISAPVWAQRRALLWLEEGGGAVSPLMHHKWQQRFHFSAADRSPRHPERLAMWRRHVRDHSHLMARAASKVMAWNKMCKYIKCGHLQVIFLEINTQMGFLWQPFAPTVIYIKKEWRAHFNKFAGQHIFNYVLTLDPACVCAVFSIHHRSQSLMT